MTDQLEDTTTDTAPTPSAFRPSRRGFFAIGGGFAAAAVLAACSDDDDGDDDGGAADTTEDTAEDTTTTTEAEADDGAIAEFAAGLELLAANTYQAALDAASSGALGAVPPAVAEFATTARDHHQAASDALAQAAGGITPVAPAEYQSEVNAAFASVTDIAGLARLALEFERKAAATYLGVLPMLQTKPAIDLVGSILPIERQHAAILHFVLGEYPVPDTFATSDGSLAPA